MQIHACQTEPDTQCYMACGNLAKELIIVAALLNEGNRLTNRSVRDHALHRSLIVMSEPRLSCQSDLAAGTRNPDYAVVFQPLVSSCCITITMLIFVFQPLVSLHLW